MWIMEEFTAIHIPGAMYTMWKFQDFSVTQILREINFWDSKMQN